MGAGTAISSAVTQSFSHAGSLLSSIAPVLALVAGVVIFGLVAVALFRALRS